MARKDVYLLRGLPGQGKSTIADALLSSINTGEAAEYCSADDYFVDEHDNYVFMKERLGDAHAYCQNLFRTAINEEVEVIVVDNTNVRRRDFADYAATARRAGYRFFEITVGTLDVEASFTRNKHQVPHETIERMAKSFER